jgi:hypothetical protein
MESKSSWVTGVGILLGLCLLGLILGKAAIEVKEFERTVTVKGLAEQEVLADVVIWPIQYTEASNSLEGIYADLEKSEEKVKSFLKNYGVSEDEITISTPFVTDKSAQQYGGSNNTQFRYVATQTVTVYSENVLEIRKLKTQLPELGKQGVALTGNEYQVRTEYLFTRLNEIKPDMIEASTNEARKAAQKFAEDSNSKLGKIKTAYQGQFSISNRDKNNTHIKKVRVVSTVVYYLDD